MDLAQFISDFRRRWAQTHLQDQDLAERLALQVGRAPLDPSLSWDDLSLTLAVGVRDPEALKELDLALCESCQTAASRLRHGDDAAFVHELQQEVRETLLLKGKLSYSGKVSLSSWLNVVATRHALNLLRAQGRRIKKTEVAALTSVFSEMDPELQVIRERYHASFNQAFNEAFRGLEKRDQTLLKLHYLEGSTLKELSALFKVHVSSVKRWLSQAIVEIHRKMREILRKELGATTRDLESLLRMLASQLEFRESSG